MAGNANTVFWKGGEPPGGSSDWRSAGSAATTAPAVEAGTTPDPPMMDGFHYQSSDDASTATAVTVAGQPPESSEVMDVTVELVSKQVVTGGGTADTRKQLNRAAPCQNGTAHTSQQEHDSRIPSGRTRVRRNAPRNRTSSR